MKSIRELWDYNKGANSCVTRDSESWEKDSRSEKILKKIIAEESVSGSVG